MANTTTSLSQVGPTPSRRRCCSTAMSPTCTCHSSALGQNYKTDFSSIIPGLGEILLPAAPTINITNITGITEGSSKNFEQTYQGNTALTQGLSQAHPQGGLFVSLQHLMAGLVRSWNVHFQRQLHGSLLLPTSCWATRARQVTSNPQDFVVRWNSAQYGMYVQDDWKVLRNLTFNFGIRYDLQHFYDNPYGTESLFVPSVGKVVVFAKSYPAITNPSVYPVLGPGADGGSTDQHVCLSWSGEDQHRAALRLRL